MIQDKFQFIANMSTRQKAIAGIFVLIVIVLVWQLSGLFGEGGESPSAPAQIAAAPPPQQTTPQPAALPKPDLSQQHSQESLEQQKQIEAKYIAALNELQMLKLEREIAETNKAITDAKLGMVTAQKSILDLLSPTPPPQVVPGGYGQGLVGGPVQAVSGSEKKPSSAIQPPQEVSYTVVSIARLKSKWNAVLGYQTNLYNVSIGDVLPVDGSTVVSIDRSGVVLEKEGMRKKISLVPII